MPGVIKTDLGYSLVPGFVEGEGQYCSALLKEGAHPSGAVAFRSSGKRPAHEKGGGEIPAGVRHLFDREVFLKSRGGTVIAVPAGLKEDVALLENFLHVVASGCAAGVVKGRDFVPDADLALSLMLAEDAFPGVDVDRDKALAFLHKDAFTLDDAPRGHVLIRYEGVNLGFVKNIGNRCNNLHPQSRRIRMNIR